METRYKLSKQDQIQFFRNVETISQLHPNQLSKLFGIVPRSYRDWKKGKFSIPTRVITLIEQQFHISLPIEKSGALQRWKSIKHAVSLKGGMARVKKFGNPGTKEGRKLGGTLALAKLRAQGKIPIEKPFHEPIAYSVELAEFVGILLGDGHIGHSQWSITLNSIKDAKYADFVEQMVYTLFGFRPTKKKRKHMHAVVIYGGGKRSIGYFQKLGLHIGNKIKQQVGVPTWIIQNKFFSMACLRGLMDTDGGIFNHTYQINGKSYSYRKLCFANRSFPLIRFVNTSLAMLQLHPRVRLNDETKRVWIYDRTKVQEYLRIVSTHNPRLLMNTTGGVG